MKYYPVKSAWFGNNTAVILIDNAVSDKGSILSHEGGHTLYNVKFLHQYMQWMNSSRNYQIGGHGVGDPSGKAADDEEEIYKNNKNK